MTDSLISETSGATNDWRVRFFAIWGGQACSLFGSQLVQFALIWYLTTATDSATTLAIASLIGLLPQVLLSPLIGALVDRWDRRLIMVVADALIAAATLGLIALFSVGLVQVWHIYALMLVRAIGSGFHSSAWGASVVLLVPKQHLTRVQGLNQAVRGGMDIVAAPFGALLLSLMPIERVLVIDLVTALIAIAPLLVIALPRLERTTAAKTSVWRDIQDGFRYVLGWPGLLIVLIMASLINLLLTPASSLLPLLVTRHFQSAAPELGWLNAAWGGGVVLGGIVLGVWGGFKRRVVTAMVGLIGLGLSNALVGFVPAGVFWLAVGAMLAAGLMTPIVNGSLGAVIQAAVAPEMQGRVFALILSVAMAMTPLSLVLAGPLADIFGIQFWYRVGGLVCALMGVIGLLVPAVMDIEREHEGHE